MIESTEHEVLALQEVVAGRYFVECEVGRGGMGVVYRARDLSLDRMVAIKLLPPALAASSELRARFLREARTAAQLSHPHIIPIHSVEEHDEVVFFVMGYVDGETLGARVRRGGPLGNSEAMRLTQEVAWALSHAHGRGVVHCDVKPDNILIEHESGRAIVTDFGIARVVATSTPAGGVVIGTPQYMSPEQARGEDVDGRSDLYSLGAALFFALTARLPIEAPSASAIMLRLLTDDAPPIASVRAVIPEALASAVDRCLERAADKRFASAADLAESMRTALEARPAVPAPIRHFLAESDAAGSEAGMAAAATLTSLVVLGASFGFNDYMAGVVFYTIAGVTGSIAAIRMARLTSEARRLLSSGYGLDAVRRSVAVDEREHERPVARTHRGRALAWLVGGALFATAAMAVTTADIPRGLILVSAAASVVAPAITIRRAVQAWFGPKAGLRRLLGGKIGSWIFGAAKIGMREPAVARALPGEPTVIAVAREADRLYAALPADQRKGLGDVPAAIGRLEAQALAPVPAGRATEREASALAALDALRLDLLRLRTAGPPTGEITRDVDRAGEIGQRIDARLAERDPSPQR